MDKAVEDAEITEVSTNDNVEDVVESPEDESTDVDTAAAETFNNEPTSPESDASKQTKAVAVDHEIDLTKADELLKQHDREVEQLMEDTLEDELTETPTALTDNITPEMASNKVTDDSGSLVHKSSVARMMNKATPLTTPLANTNPLTNTKSQDRVKRAQSIGRFSSRNSSDSKTIDRSFNFSFGLDLPEDADVVKCGDYASVLVNAKSSTGSKLRTFMVI